MSQRDEEIIDTLEHHHRLSEIAEVSVLADNPDPAINMSYTVMAFECGIDFISSLGKDLGMT
jgi:hypothetical protein